MPLRSFHVISRNYLRIFQTLLRRDLDGPSAVTIGGGEPAASDARGNNNTRTPEPAAAIIASSATTVLPQPTSPWSVCVECVCELWDVRILFVQMFVCVHWCVH